MPGLTLRACRFGVPVALACLLLTAFGARAQDCALTVDARQTAALATVTATSPCRRDPSQTVKVYYEDDVFLAHFDPTGKAVASFALFHATANEIRVRSAEGQSVSRSLDVPEFDDVMRVTLLWQAPVRLKLHVVEPGRRLGQFGDINEDQPNADLQGGLGKLDLAWPAPEKDRLGDPTSAEQSYVLMDAGRERHGVFSPYLEFASRGSTPRPPFCGDAPLASVEFRLIVLDRGKITDRSFQSDHAKCGEMIAEPYRRIR